MPDLISMETKLIILCRQQEAVYIYGAGHNGQAAYHYLKKRGIEVRTFLVSHIFGNPQCLFGKNVIAIDDFKEEENKKGLIIVPMIRKSKAYKEIFDKLVNERIQNVCFFSEEMLAVVKQEEMLRKNREFFHAGAYYLGENISVEPEYGIFVMKAGEEEYHWRFPIHMADGQAAENIQELFTEKSAIEEFEELYGRYHVFSAGGHDDICNEKKYAVYMVCCHADRMTAEREIPSWMIPIQAGASLTGQKICGLQDNEGDNISERNGNYSECTAIYWMWKNAPREDYIGLCHYRRHFLLEENEICGMAAHSIDVLLTSPSFVAETTGVFFSSLVPNSDIEAMMKAIKKTHSEYLPAAEKFLRGRFYPPCNIFVMKYDVFQEYGEFAFPIAFEIERFYEDMFFERKDRYMGFIMECLLGIFVIKNKDRLKTAYADMKFYGK